MVNVRDLEVSFGSETDFTVAAGEASTSDLEVNVAESLDLFNAAAFFFSGLDLAFFPRNLLPIEILFLTGLLTFSFTTCGIRLENGLLVTKGLDSVIGGDLNEYHTTTTREQQTYLALVHHRLLLHHPLLVMEMVGCLETILLRTFLPIYTLFTGGGDEFILIKRGKSKASTTKTKVIQ